MKIIQKEVIDGQQRIRTILSFIRDEFVIKKIHNEVIGGQKYSELDENFKTKILGFNILVEVVNEDDDNIIYDMFARLNSNNYVLNQQEIRNAKYWGEFKSLALSLTNEYRTFFYNENNKNANILTEKDVSRQRDSEIINSMVILAMEGVISETPKVIENFYKKYDLRLPGIEIIKEKIQKTMEIIQNLFNSLLDIDNLSCFNNKNYFFTLYAVIFNQLFGLKNSNIPQNKHFSLQNWDSNNSFKKLLERIFEFINQYELNKSDWEDNKVIDVEWKHFFQNHRSRTTNKEQRIQRISLLNSFLME